LEILVTWFPKVVKLDGDFSPDMTLRFFLKSLFAFPSLDWSVPNHKRAAYAQRFGEFFMP